MSSKEVEIEESTSELKHLRFLKEIALKFLAVLSNVYDFAKENVGVLETKIVSVENAVVSAVGPVFNKLKDVAEQIIVFVDDKLEKYAPILAKSLIDNIQSLIDKIIPLVEELLTKAKSLLTPLITTVISLLKEVIKTVKSLLQKILTIIESLPFFDKAEALFDKGLDTIKSLPLVAKALSLLQNPADLAKQALDTTKSVVGGIPVVGNVAQSLLDLVDDNPVLGVVSSAAQNIVKQVQATGLKATLKSAYLSFNVVGLPVIAQFWYKANTYPLFHSLAELILPVVEKLSEYYNKLVRYMDGQGYELFDYLPLVPIDEMKAAYKVVKMAMDGLSAVGDLAGAVTGNNNNSN
ncbi:REF/SRPP-like protein At1g67360 [Cynara cardunculus var. scolymus]|uniref:Rubber elongation factor n=1 Tax=Cynara cardunculus var. scolymus TaxID=59895 RepID=A0A103YAW0_CYNCS|nr:REF/SRPP-like protein At1g67360 [Cynara cardunculus var. scolymus]KVI05720.1 Rubber elongation factor [Cynara cardunculus var. scolymus]